MVLNWVRELWKILETSDVVSTGRVLLASGMRLGTLLNILHIEQESPKNDLAPNVHGAGVEKPCLKILIKPIL